jgi:hypothetical protein
MDVKDSSNKTFPRFTRKWDIGVMEIFNERAEGSRFNHTEYAG